MPDDPVSPRRSSALPWLLLLLPVVAIAAVWLAMRKSETASTRQGGAGAVAEAPPPSEEAISNLNVGVRLLEQLRPADAATRFEGAVALQPRWVPALVDLAIARMNVLEPASDDAAATAAQQALNVAPGDARAKYVLSYVRGERQRRFADALPLLRDVVASVPGDAVAWAQLGRAAQEVAAGAAGTTGPAGAAAGLTTEAEHAFRRALELDPRLVEANYRLGRLLLDSPDPAKQAEGGTILAHHQDLLKGRPAVQQNYFVRGALALAYPWSPPRHAPPMPAHVTLKARTALTVPPGIPGEVADASVSAQRYRGGLSIADLDGDGRLDVLAPMRDVEQPAMLVWRQGDGGAFLPPVGVGPTGHACGTAAVGDVDRDGKLDALLTCNTGNVLLVGAGGGLLAPAPRPEMAWPSLAGLSATVVDVDHDGDLDLHVVEPLSTAQTAAGTPRRWRATEWVWRNDGTGHFQEMGGALGLPPELDSEEAIWSDFDGDNAVDLVASVSGSGLTLLRNDRSERFTAYSLPGLMPFAGEGPPPFRLAALDVDHDRDLDLVVSNAGELTLILNESQPGAPSFRASAPVRLPPAAVPASLLVADMDLDGWRELVLFGGGEISGDDFGGVPTLLTFRAGDTEVLVPIRPVSADGFDAQVAAVADMDGDGDVDIVARRRTGEPVVLGNEFPPGRAWLGIATVGREGRSNPQGFGARVTVDSGSLTTFVEHRAAVMPLCHVAAPEIFGLGARTTVDGVGVLWPSGIQQGEIDVALSSVRVVEELDRQPSSCPMLYGWDGSAWRFLSDCFDTAPLGLWVAPGVHITGEADEMLRLRPGSVLPVEGVVNVAVSEFLNESLLADRVAMVAVDEDPARSIVVDEAARLASPAPEVKTWSVAGPLAVKARQDGKDVSAALAAEDAAVAGWSKAERWLGFAAASQLVLDVPAGARVLVLTGSLNFPNSTNIFGAAQAGLELAPPRVEVQSGAGWKEMTKDCGVPAGFHKDVVVDLASLGGRAGRLRITTNLQVSWDRAVAYTDARPVARDSMKDLALLRAEKRRFGIPSEVKGPENRWREFPHDVLDPAPRWQSQGGTVTPDGDVSDLVGAPDDHVAVVRPGEEILLGFDDASVPLAAGLQRTHVLVTRGWVKDRDPHTALSESVDPLPKPGSETYPE